MRAVKTNSIHIGVIEITRLQFGIAQLSLPQLRPTKSNIQEFCAKQLRSGEIGLSKIHIYKSRIEEAPPR